MLKMETTALWTVVQKLCHDEARFTDSELLEQFITRRDQDAFAALMQRHGPMVLGVCRRVLSNEADREDAFQATFLVLVLKAASIRPRGMVGNWLYGVAHTTALKARAMNARRLAKEREAREQRMPEAAGENAERLQSLLDQELKALPDKYRAAIILCDLEGKSIKDAARQLGCPQGTIGTRLARGRRLLSRRLTRHGLTLSGGLMATGSSQEMAVAGVPPLLMSSTAKASALAAVDSGVFSAKVIALTKGTLQTMFVSNLKMMMVMLVAGMTVFSGGLLAYHYSAQAQPEKSAAANDGVKTDKEKTQFKEDGKRKETDTAPKEIDPKVIESWKKAGATLGWSGRNEFGSVQFFEEKPKDIVCLPAFGLPRFEPGVIAKLPAPAVPFALAFRTEGIEELHVTDAGLKELAGLENLQSLALGGTKVTDAGMKELAALKSLQTLILRDALQVTDVGVKELAGVKSLKNLDLYGARKLTNDGVKTLGALENLQVLDLERTQVTDTGLKDLAGLKSLQVLNLSGTDVTDSGLIELIGLTSLQILDLTSTKVTDAGLKNLAGHQELRQLELTGTKVTDTGLKELAGLKNLQILGLSGTGVTDEGLKELAGFKSLYSIYVSSPKITDAGLKHLADLKGLRVLGLYQTKVTDEGVAQLRKVHPKLVIVGRQTSGGTGGSSFVMP
jgi:RNA polymerase sigma factor (sigma-70 family)